jgi:hypothetical protein
MAIDNQALSLHFERYGQVMNIRDTLDPFVKYVEYWDSRDAVAAFDAISDNSQFNDGYLIVEFSWDQFDRLSDRSKVPYVVQGIFSPFYLQDKFLYLFFNNYRTIGKWAIKDIIQCLIP